MDNGVTVNDIPDMLPGCGQLHALTLGWPSWETVQWINHSNSQSAYCHIKTQYELYTVKIGS